MDKIPIHLQGNFIGPGHKSLIDDGFLFYSNAATVERAEELAEKTTMLKF